MDIAITGTLIVAVAVAMGAGLAALPWTDHDQTAVRGALRWLALGGADDTATPGWGGEAPEAL